MFRSIALLLLAVSAICAQTAAVNGTIAGVVRDPSGAGVVNAIVRASNLETGFRRSVETNQAGEYEIGLLPLGKYEVTIHAPGFAEYREPSAGVREWPCA